MKALENELKRELQKKFDLMTADKYFYILITPHQLDQLNKERTAWLKILLKKRLKQTDLLHHTKKFPGFFINIWSTKKALNQLNKRYKKERAEISKIKKELELVIREKNKIKKQQYNILKKLSPKANFYSWTLQTWGIKRFDIKFCWAGSEYYLCDFLYVIAMRAGVDFKTMMWWYREKDIINALNGKKLDQNEIQKRKAYYLYHFHNGKLSFYAGLKAKQKVTALLKYSDIPDKKSKCKIFKGQPANPGKIKGRVKVIHCNDLKGMKKGIKKFKKDDILITEMTQPNMVMLIKKAAGIITDEGGIISHAAVISREFKIPCVVGAHFATKILKDNDIVELDANIGTVKKIS